MREARTASGPGARAEASRGAVSQQPGWLQVRRRIARTMAITAFGLVALVALIATGHVDAKGVAILVLFFVPTIVGIEVGYHRLLSHGAFSARPAARAAFAVLGAMAMQGPPSFWITTHRRHHRFADEAKDPHAPSEPMSPLRRFWHLHVGWHFDRDAVMIHGLDFLRYARDLARDPVIQRVEALYPLIVAAGFVLPTIIGALAYGTVQGAVLGFLWGGPIRIFAVNQVVWGTNSVCHTFGARPFESGDRSTNVWWIALLSFGAGWHNAHHAFPGSARDGFGWREPDFGYLLVRGLERLGLVYDVHVPNPEAIRARRR